MVDQPHGLLARQMKTYVIERGVAAQAARLREIERAAGALFRAIGMGDIADGDVTPASILEARAASGQLYVAIDAAGVVAGFLIWSAKDGLAYIEEVSVDPDHAGHRLAARMIDQLAEDVKDRHAALTLATFRDVDWNAPYYARLGFVELPQKGVGPQHQISWKEQAKNGLDMTRRLFMIREL
jgi:ribosomal protein S18 acetylase RimI-like enzyme